MRADWKGFYGPDTCKTAVNCWGVGCFVVRLQVLFQYVKSNPLSVNRLFLNVRVNVCYAAWVLE